MRNLKWVAAAFVLFPLMVDSARAEKYTDPSGFAFTYPNDWIAITQLNKDMLPPDITNWLSRNRVNLNQVKVIVLQPGQADFLTNVNVVVQNQQMPINNDSVKKLLEILPKQFRSMGVTVEDLTARVGQLGGTPAVILDFQSRMPVAQGPLKQRQAMFAGGGKTYTVTCTSTTDRFPQDVAAFDAILASFMVPAPIAQGFNWNPIIRGAVVGGVVGGAVALVMAFVRRKRPTQQKDRSEQD